MPLFSLLIGINNYHPESNVPALLGCANDVEAVESFLESQFKVEDLNAVSLIDEAATYDNIIKHFGAAHLAKAKKGDTVFIHFSGHGARGFSAPEFKAYFPDGLDENLVCYDSRVGANYDLADKELAVLIERIAVKGVDVIVLLDCCHSGSGTRSSEELEIAAAREWEDREEVRSLESYLNRYFVNNLYVPNSRHLLLAACEKREKAFELSNNQGVFTN
ncbi:MAG: caspase family protein, partial [Saprospiraceae bacterium]